MSSQKQKKNINKKSGIVQITYKFGQRPVLYLFKKKADEIPSETISIATWEGSSLESYIDSHLI